MLAESLVLWLYFATPGAWGGIPMSSGWVRGAQLTPRACHETLELKKQIAVCLPPGTVPRGRLARNHTGGQR